MKLPQIQPSRMRGAMLLLLLSLFLIGGYVLVSGISPSPPENAGTPASESAADPVTAPPEPIQHVVQRGENLFDILCGFGISADQIDRLVKDTHAVYNLASLTAGNALRISLTQEDPVRLTRLCYEIDGLNELEAVAGEDRFNTRKITHDIEVRYDRAEGAIASNLYDSAVGAGLSPEIVMGLTDIFAWDINFFTDIREGDRYAILYERQYVRGAFQGYGKILAARFINQGQEHVAIHHRQGEQGGYYDAAGRPIRKLFLKAPLNYRRISSGFSRSRLHPVFNVRRPHLGVDYAAPTGTPVVALGGGTVVYRGWSGGFGKLIRIQHPAGYVTSYGHLSGYAKGLAKGAHVRQGQVIGYVGSTGVSTGPHLDFRVTLKGKFINPLSLKPVNSPPLKGEALETFRRLSLEKLALLDGAGPDPTLQIGKGHPSPRTETAMNP